MTDSTNNLSDPTASEAIDTNLSTENVEGVTVDSQKELKKLLDSTLTTDEKFTALHHQFSTLLVRLEKSEVLVEDLRKDMYHRGFDVYDDEAEIDAHDFPPESFTSTMPTMEDESKAIDATHTHFATDSESEPEPEGFGPHASLQATPHREIIKEESTDDTPQTRTMALWQHLEELRWVLIKCISILGVATGIGIYFSSFIYDIIMHPVQKQIDAGTVQVFYHTPPSAFMVKIKMALLAGIILSIPFMLGFVWQFISPGLKGKERNYLLVAQFVGTGCFLVGGSFGYSFLPLGLPILIKLGDPSVQQLWPIGEYVSFCTKLILAFGFVFEMPVVLGTLVRLGVVKSHTLVKARPYALIIILLVAALLTPPDVFSQLALGFPMVILYEISILVGKWQEKKTSKRDEEED